MGRAVRRRTIRATSCSATCGGRKSPSLLQGSARLDGGYALHGREARFEIPRYDRRETMVIDPALAFSTYLGGSSLDDAYAIATDGSGNVYVTGSTLSTDFPMENALQATPGGLLDVFTTKIDTTAPAIVYSTYLGGNAADIGEGIAVDSSGAVYLRRDQLVQLPHSQCRSAQEHGLQRRVHHQAQPRDARAKPM